MMPFVTIVVTAFLEKSKPYLDLCIESIRSLDYPKDRFEVIIVSPKTWTPLYDDCLTVTPYKDHYYNGHALNFGALHAKPHTDHLLFLNDDVILTRNSLKNLVLASSYLGDKALLMPISNDMQNKYYLGPDQPLGPYRIEHVKDADYMFNFSSPYDHFGVVFFETLCLYANLVPIGMWKQVGEYDEVMEGQTDIDYCLRVKKAGYINGVVLNSFMYHAGGASADLTHTAESRAKSLEQFNEKWGEQ